MSTANLEPYSLLSPEPMEADECMMIRGKQAVDKPCCCVHDLLKSTKKLPENHQDGVSIFTTVPCSVCVRLCVGHVGVLDRG